MHQLQSRLAQISIVIAASLLLCVVPLNADNVPTRPGYYRFPAIHGDTVIFTAEGDLWSVSIKGGEARRLTSNPGKELYAAISPDGKTVAFTADYEGPADVYTMPVEGGLPQRRTWDGGRGRCRLDARRPRSLSHAPLLHAARSKARRRRHRRPPRNLPTLAVRRRRLHPRRQNTLLHPPALARQLRPNAIKAAPRKTSGATTPAPKPSLSLPITPAHRTIPCSGMAASISSPTATAP